MLRASWKTYLVVWWSCCTKDIYAAPGLHGYCATWHTWVWSSMPLMTKKGPGYSTFFQAETHDQSSMIHSKRELFLQGASKPIKTHFCSSIYPLSRHEQLLKTQWGVCSFWSTKGTRQTFHENSLNVFRAVRDPWRPVLRDTPLGWTNPLMIPGYFATSLGLRKIYIQHRNGAAAVSCKFSQCNSEQHWFISFY